MGKFLCPRGTSEAFCQGHQFGTLRLAAPKQGPNILLGQTVTLPIFGGWVSVGDPVGSSCQNVFFKPTEAGRCYALWVVAHLLLRAHSEAPESTRGAGNQLFLTVVPALASDARAFEPYLARSLGTMMPAGVATEFTWEGREVSVLRWGSRVTAITSKLLGARSAGDPKHPDLGGYSDVESKDAGRQVNLI